jgi:hypothetical protein
VGIELAEGRSCLRRVLTARKAHWVISSRWPRNRVALRVVTLCATLPAASEAMRKRLVIAVVISVAVMVVGCGRATSQAPGALGSASPDPSAFPSPSPTSGPSDPNAFQPNDCTYASSPGTPAPKGSDNFGTVVSVPQGWTLEPTAGSIAVMSSPATYSYLPTTMRVESLLGYFPGQTPESIAPNYYGPSSHSGTPAINLVGQVEHCTVNGDSAAYFQYTQGSAVGYLVLWLHFNYLYSLRLEGTGGIDSRAVHDAKGVLASLVWSVASPPPR